MAALSLNDWSFLSSEDLFTLDLSRSTLIECIDHYTEAKSKLHPSVPKSSELLKFHLHNLQEQIDMTLHPRHVTSMFYNHLVGYLEERGLMLTSIRKICKSLRTVIAWASDYKAIIHPSYKAIDIKAIKIEHIALSADDVSFIYHYDLSHVKMRPQLRRTLEAVRDMFVLGCNLGQRHSDLVRIDKNCFREGRFHILQQKTKNKANIDLRRLTIDMKVTKKILEKYNYTAPYPYSLSKYDYHIHQLMRIVFGEETVSQSIVVGNLVTKREIFKYKAIASHTSRRTFATHNYKVKEYPVIEVMQATGHTTESSFRKYICGEEDE